MCVCVFMCVCVCVTYAGYCREATDTRAAVPGPRCEVKTSAHIADLCFVFAYLYWAMLSAHCESIAAFDHNIRTMGLAVK